MANTSPYTSDDDDYDLSDDSPQKNGGKLDISNNSGTRNPTLINLSSIVKSEIFDDDDGDQYSNRSRQDLPEKFFIFHFFRINLIVFTFLKMYVIQKSFSLFSLISQPDR